MSVLKITSLHGFILALILLAACRDEIEKHAELPKDWRHLVKTEGQYYPIPESWLSTPEGKIAHNLKLPDLVPKPVPFDFSRAEKNNKKRSDVALKYFDHLCETEAGEWIFKRIEGVEGLYFSRPRDQPSDQYLSDVYAPEAPWVERHFQLMGDSLRDRGGRFVSPPAFSYHYVEEPRRDVKWQENISTTYIRLFGYTSEVVHNPKYRTIPGAQRYLRVTEKTPMQMEGISEVTAPYVYTWRGITRPRDRENGIAGAELIIYDRITGEVISVRRSFQITRRNPRTTDGASWMISPTCNQAKDELSFLTLSEYALRVLGTIEPSTTGRK